METQWIKEWSKLIESDCCFFCHPEILLITSNIIIGAYYNRKVRCRIDIPNIEPSIHIKIKYTTDKNYSIHGSAMKSVHKNHNS